MVQRLTLLFSMYSTQIVMIYWFGMIVTISSRKTGIVYHFNNKPMYTRTAFKSDNILFNTTLCRARATINNLKECTCILTSEKYDDILSYTLEENSEFVAKLFKGYGYNEITALSKLSRLSTHFQKERGELFASLANQFNVRGTTVIKCKGYNTELKYFKESFHKLYQRGNSQPPSVIDFNQDSYDINYVVIQLYLVKSTDASVIVVLCPDHYASLLLDLSKRVDMQSTIYVWMFMTPLQLLSSSAPINSLSIMPVIVNKSTSSVEEHVLLTSGKDGDTAIMKSPQSYCESNKRTMNATIEEREFFFTNGSRRLYVYKVLTLNTRKHWSQIGQVDVKRSLTFRDISNILTTFPRHLVLNTVKIVTIVDPPFVLLRTKTYWEASQKKCQLGLICYRLVAKTTVPECCIGYMIDLLIKVKVDVGLDVYLYLVEDSTYGTYDHERQAWTGMVGDIATGKADIAFAALTISSGRSKIIDFTAPFMTGGIGLLTLSKREEIGFLNFEFLKPLSTDLWMVVLGSILVFSFFMMLMECLPRFCALSYVWREAILYLVGLAFQRDLGGKNPAGLGTRTSTIVVAVATMIIMSTYTAVLTANKVSIKQQLPITGFRDEKITNPTTAFIYAIPKNSVYTSFFKESNDPAFNRMHHFMKPYNFVNTDKAIEQLKAGKLDAIIHDYSVLYYYVTKDPSCQLQFAGDSLPDPGLGLGVARNSILKVTLSDTIRRYKEDGSLKRIQDRWMDTKCTSSLSGGNANPKELSVSNFGGLILLVIISIVVSMIIYVVEYCTWRLKMRLIEIDNTVRANP